jgi:hypothetical protein
MDTCGTTVESKHYRSRPLPRVSNALGEDPKTLGEDLTPSVPSTVFFFEKTSSPSATLGEEILFFLKKTLPRVQLSGKAFHFF